MDQFKKYDLLDNSRAVEHALVGAVAIIFLGLLIPQTMFWGEYVLSSCRFFTSLDNL